MTTFTFLALSMVYAGFGHAATMNYVQDASEVGRADLNAARPRAAALRQAWGATFMILIHKPGDRVEYASAFVTFSALGPGGRRLQLVTSDHALGSWCDDHHCRGVDLHVNGRVQRDPRTGGRTLLSQPLNVTSLRVLRRDAVLDLAVIQITVDPSINPRPLLIGQVAPVAGEAAYAVGFPNVFKGRTDLTVDDPEVLTRRWSRGQVIGTGTLDLRTGDLTDTRDERDLVTTSVPAKQGSSGGPLVDTDGYVVGVIRWADLTNGADRASAAVNLRDLRHFLRLDDVASN